MRLSHLKQVLLSARRRLIPPSEETIRRERGQALLRIAVVAGITTYLVFSPGSIAEWPWYFQQFYGATVLYSIAVFIHTRRASSYKPSRQLMNNVMDVTGISYIMIQTGETGALLFTLYVWVTIGNGFRFGNKALTVSTVLSAIGFGVVTTVSEFWNQHIPIAAGMMFALIVLPLYAAHLIRMLNIALHRAEEANAAKGRFLARMSHELRTPLNGILGTTELLDGNRRLGPEERTLLQVIRDSVQVSLRQINNVLDFSKIEAGKLVLERTTLDLHQLVNTTTAMLRAAALQKGLRFLVRIAPDAPYRLVGDPHHLREILLNLISNAIKFTEHGYVCLEVSGRVDSAGKLMLHLEVHDTGIGIATDAQDRIFESFSQEDTSTTRQHGGTGLGTTIAKQLVELMGGRIGVHSTKGRGSSFWCDIPLDQQQRSADRDIFLTGMRAVLMSEDAKLAAHYTQITRAHEGQLFRATSPGAVLEAIARGLRLGNPLHTVLVDSTLAFGRDGVHLCDELALHAMSANVPLILITPIMPSAEQMRDWGYSTALTPDAGEDMIVTALRASPVRLIDGNQRVVSVAPWQWGKAREPGENRPRLLVADDNRTNRMIVQRILEQSGYEVVLVDNGETALERLNEGGWRLAILDMHMPGLDGTDVLRRYRMMRPRSRLPVIVLTANASLDAKRECADAGADAYLAKPVGAAELVGEVDRLVQQSAVESIVHRIGDSPAAASAEVSVPREMLDISVLAELDRVYHDPVELAKVVDEFEREGWELLEKIEQTCSTRRHPGFCDLVHAFKGNAANIGGMRLMQVCREAESAGLARFLRDPVSLLGMLRQTFEQTLAALHELVETSRGEQRQPVGGGPGPGRAS